MQTRFVISIIILFLVTGATALYYADMLLPRERPAHIPATAVWAGDYKGGHWFELIENKDTLYKFKIYKGYNGEFLTETYFYFDAYCKGVNVNNEEILSGITYFDGNISLVLKGKSCTLYPTSIK